MATELTELAALLTAGAPIWPSSLHNLAELRVRINPTSGAGSMKTTA